VWLFGLSRVRLKEAPSQRMYRRVEIEPLVEKPPSKEGESMLRERLRQAILARCEESTTLPKEIPAACLADLLLQRLSLPQREMEKLFEELDVEMRAECALEIHALRPHNRQPRRRKAKE
jgi:hypothetical protein